MTTTPGPVPTRDSTHRSHSIRLTEAAIDKVKTSLQSLRTSAAGQAKDQIQAVEDSLNDLETAISNVSPGGEAAVVPAAATVVSSGSALVQSLQDIDCN
jgi:hypothetical protein